MLNFIKNKKGDGSLGVAIRVFTALAVGGLLMFGLLALLEGTSMPAISSRVVSFVEFMSSN